MSLNNDIKKSHESIRLLITNTYDAMDDAMDNSHCGKKNPNHNNYLAVVILFKVSQLIHSNRHEKVAQTLANYAKSTRVQ